VALRGLLGSSVLHFVANNLVIVASFLVKTNINIKLFDFLTFDLLN